MHCSGGRDLSFSFSTAVQAVAQVIATTAAQIAQAITASDVACFTLASILFESDRLRGLDSQFLERRST